MKKTSWGCISPLGLIAIVLVLAGFGAARWSGGSRLFSSGPLNAVAGSPLGGVSSHAELGGQCSACHVALWQRGGMSERCLDCHSAVADELSDPTSMHGVLKPYFPEMDCRACHTEHHGAQGELTFVGMNEFPHDQVGFSLIAHETGVDGSPMQCSGCHTESLIQMDQQVCADCHTEIEPAWAGRHAANFGQANVANCVACHDGVDRYGKNFDHASTGFTLAGEHAEIPCQDCHHGAVSMETLQTASAGCYDCHANNDVHGGSMGQDCGLCHRSDTWEGASFDHSATGFELTGRHSNLECSSCHPNQQFANTPADCIGCHARNDVHGGQFGSDCGRCHNTSTWEGARFDHAAANATDCYSCHAKDDVHRGENGTDCGRCHNTSNWEAEGEGGDEH